MGRRGFTRYEILEIRRAHAWGHNKSELAQAYGISEKAVRDIVKGRTYSRVRDDAPDTPPQPLPLQGTPIEMVGQGQSTMDGSRRRVPNASQRRIAPPAAGQIRGDA